MKHLQQFFNLYIFITKRFAPLSAISSKNPLKKEVNCRSLDAGVDDPSTNGEDLSEQNGSKNHIKKGKIMIQKNWNTY